MATLTTATTNFDKTVTALVLRQIDANLRTRSVYLQEGSFVRGDLIPGTNLVRHIAFGDMSVTTNNNVVTPGTQPWLTEGVPPTAEAMTIAYEEYGVGQAGRTLEISDVAMAESPHKLFAVAADKIGVNAVQTVDLFVGNALHAGTARTIYAGAATSRVTVAATHNITGALIRRAVAVLKQANIPMFPDGTFHAFINPMISYDLMSDTATGGWLDVSKYANPEGLLNGEIGKYMGVRFIETNVANLFADSGVGGTVDVYSTFIFGPDAFAFGDLQSIQAYMVSAPDKADPLGQKAIVGWKAMFGAKLLAQTGAGNKYARIEAASSIGAN
jgi:N4-gp56 family major capsid protein